MDHLAKQQGVEFVLNREGEVGAGLLNLKLTAERLAKSCLELQVRLEPILGEPSPTESTAMPEPVTLMGRCIAYIQMQLSVAESTIQDVTSRVQV